MANILFNASKCGLGPNGGTKTIIRSVDTLRDMGHSANILANTNNYTWGQSDTIGSIDGHYDAVVSVSVWDLEHTLTLPIKNRVWWCRGWEKWVRGEDWFIQQANMFAAKGGRIIVNSSWLINQFKEMCGIDVELCYSGLDLSVWDDRRGTRKKPYTVGGMIYDRRETKRSDILLSLSKEKLFNKRFINIKSGLSDKELKDVYQQCEIWVSPTELEGFHQTAAEACLCGCLIVCNRINSNGMGDYATDETAMRYSGYDELLACLESPDFGKVSKMQGRLMEIGSREKNMAQLVSMIGGQK